MKSADVQIPAISESSAERDRFLEQAQSVLASLCEEPSVMLVASLLKVQSPAWSTVDKGRQQLAERVAGTFFDVLPPQLDGLLALRRESWGEAVRAFESAVSRHRSGSIHHGAECAVWLCLSWRMVLERLPVQGQYLRAEILERMGQALARAKRHTRGWEVCRPQFLREQACWQALRGRYRRARTLFEESYALADRLGMKPQAIWTLYERGRFAEVAGWSDWTDDRADGLELAQFMGLWIPGVKAREPGWPAHFAHLDRFRCVLAAGRRLASLRDKAQVWNRLKVEAQALLRCHEIELLRPDGDQQGWSRSLAQLALEEGRAVTEADIPQSSRDSLLTQTRSMLMVPVLAHGHPVRLLAARQKMVVGYFGQEEAQLAEYLATLAGAGLENASVLAERDAALGSLRLSEERFRGFFESAGVGAALLDGEGVVRRENPYLRHLLGGSVEGRSLLELSYEPDREACREGFASLCKGTDKVDLESRFRRVHGEVIWVQLDLARMPDSESAHVPYLATLADITHRRLSEVLTFLENERRSLAGDIHDEIAQTAGALHIQLSAQEANLESARLLSGQLTRDTARLIASLHNSPGQREPLLKALHYLVSAFAADTEVEVTRRLPDHEPSLSGLHALVLYRFVQEGLTNIRKHAGARRVELELNEEVDGVRVALDDDGCGFEPAIWFERGPAQSHFGLKAMRDRARLSGGRLTVSSEAGLGSKIELWLPTTDKSSV